MPYQNRSFRLHVQDGEETNDGYSVMDDLLNNFSEVLLLRNQVVTDTAVFQMRTVSS